MAGATLGEMATDLGITRSHCHAILLTLIHSSLVLGHRGKSSHPARE